MKASVIEKRKARTQRAILLSGHKLEVLYVGGAHVRWFCVRCKEHFVINEYRPPETPGYYDDNDWTKCEA